MIDKYFSLSNKLDIRQYSQKFRRLFILTLPISGTLWLLVACLWVIPFLAVGLLHAFFTLAGFCGDSCWEDIKDKINFWRKMWSE